MRKKLRILFSIMFMTTVTFGETKMGAVIFTGNEFHHEGLEIQQALIGKGYDVHLTQVQADKKIFEISDWSETPLLKALDQAGNYDKLLFIVDGHGLETIGVNIYWDSLLQLVKSLEEKANEMFVYLHTCYSGNAVDKWMSQLGSNVKVFTTSSCKGKMTMLRQPYWSLTTQLFTGNYMNYPGTPYGLNNMKPNDFEQINCDSTIDNINAAMSQPCGNYCYNMHVHKGGDVKLKDWKILPRSLSDLLQTSDINTIENAHKAITDIPFKGESCPLDIKPFTETTVTFESPLYLVPNVMFVNAIDVWRMVTIYVHYNRVAIPSELKKKKIKPYATILKINEICDLGKNCDRKNGILNLMKVSELKIGYYDTRETWIMNDDSTGSKKDNTQTIIIAVLVTVITIIAGIMIYYFCYCKKKQRRRSPRSQPNPIVISSGGTQFPDENTNTNQHQVN